MAHGDSDKKIPCSFGENNYNALKTTDKQFVYVKGAGHTNLHTKGGAAYWEKMKAFILKNTEPEAECIQNTEGSFFQLAKQ